MLLLDDNFFFQGTHAGLKSLKKVLNRVSQI